METEKCFEMSNDTEVRVSPRIADKTILLDIIETDPDGDWIFCRMSLEKTREFAQFLIDSCNTLEGV